MNLIALGKKRKGNGKIVFFPTGIIKPGYMVSQFYF